MLVEPAAAPFPDPVSAAQEQQPPSPAVVSDAIANTGAATSLSRVAPLAERGDRSAQYLLGVIYSTGNGVLQDEVEAVKWFRRAAEQGLTAAQFSVGLAYALGAGIGQSDDDALGWFRQAAEKGFAKAQFMIGTAYMAARGVPHDAFQGMQWYRRAADLDYAPAQFWLGMTYHPSPGGEIDPVGATALIRRAAAQGYAPAQLRFGQLLLKGTDNPLADPDKTVIRDEVDAYKWFDVCARRVASDDDLRLDAWILRVLPAIAASCTEARNQLYGSLTPEQLAEAQRQAFEWLNAHDGQGR